MNIHGKVLPATLDEWYTVNSSAWYEYKLPSPSNTKLSISFKEVCTNEPYPEFMMKTIALNHSLYQLFQIPFQEQSNNLTILGLFNVTFASDKSNKNAVSFSNLFLYPYGIANTYANTIHTFIFNGTHFEKPPNEIINILGSGFQWKNYFPMNQSVIVGLFAYQFTPQFNSQILVPGPSVFEFNFMETNNFASSLSQSIAISFPHERGGYQHSPYFTLNHYTPSVNNEIPFGYIALRSLQYNQSTDPAPYLGGQRWYFKFNASQGFTDLNGQVVSIRTSSLKCACAKDMNSKFITMWHDSLSDNQLTCDNGVICNYFAVIAKPTVEPTTSGSTMTVTPIMIGSTIQDGIHSIIQRKYYKFDMLPYTKVTIMVSCFEGIGILYVNAYSIPETDNFDEMTYISSSVSSSSLTVNNYLTEVKEVFVMIRSSASKMSYSITTKSHEPEFQDPLGPAATFGVVVASAVFAMCIVSILVIVVLVIMYKNKKTFQTTMVN